MNGIKATVIIAVAFLIGAIAPLLGIVAAAAMAGAAWATRQPSRISYDDPTNGELLRLARQIQAEREQRHR